MSLTLSEISDLMKQESPVFIVGAPRSGTSILYNRLQYHSSFKLSSPGVELSESKVFGNPYRAYYPANESTLGYMLGNESYYQQFLDSTKSILSGVKFMQRLAVKRNISRRLLWTILLNDHLVQSFFYYAKQARGVKRLLEKTPTHIFRLPEIKSTFPSAKLLFIYRHPVDVFSSYKRRIKVETKLGKNQKEVDWLKLTPNKFCDNYANYIGIAEREYISNPSGFMMFKYEDFTSNPQDIFQRICEFIGEPYEGELLASEEQQNSWVQDPYLFKKITEKTKSWQDYISESDARFIEDRLNKVMSQLDYPRYT